MDPGVHADGMSLGLGLSRGSPLAALAVLVVALLVLWWVGRPRARSTRGGRSFAYPVAVRVSAAVGLVAFTALAVWFARVDRPVLVGAAASALSGSMALASAWALHRSASRVVMSDDGLLWTAWAWRRSMKWVEVRSVSWRDGAGLVFRGERKDLLAPMTAHEGHLVAPVVLARLEAGGAQVDAASRALLQEMGRPDRG